MNAGRLNKSEKVKLRRQWLELQRMIEDCGPGNASGGPAERDRAALSESLVTARNALGSVLRWQDPEPDIIRRNLPQWHCGTAEQHAARPLTGRAAQ